MVEAGRVEILGGGFYEPILTDDPAPRPRRADPGYSRLISRNRLRREGPRHVGARSGSGNSTWSQRSAEAGIEYTILDDFHFQRAGLTETDLHGYYLTEDEGQLLKVFPGCERLRYLIPFDEPQPPIDYLRRLAEPAARLDGRLRRRRREVRLLARDARPCLQERLAAPVLRHAASATAMDPGHDVGRAVDQRSPAGKIYLPDACYREMTEWALPADQLVEYERGRHEMEHDPHWSVVVSGSSTGRLLAQLQGEVPRKRRDVHPHADGQPAAAGAERPGTMPNWWPRPVASSIGASAIAATGTVRLAASICRICATPFTST